MLNLHATHTVCVIFFIASFYWVETILAKFHMTQITVHDFVIFQEFFLHLLVD